MKPAAASDRPLEQEKNCAGTFRAHSTTGWDLTKEDLAAARWPLDRSPYLLETSLPVVFAVDDVRCGSVKRVASAVGEGSIAVSFVHRAFAEQFADHRDLK